MAERIRDKALPLATREATCKVLPVVCALLVLALWPCSAVAQEPVVAAYDVCHTSGDNMLAPALMSLGSREARAIIEYVCLGMGSNCSGAAKLYTDAAHRAARQIAPKAQDQVNGIIEPPRAYEVCRAYLGERSGSGDTVNAARLVRDKKSDGLLFTLYAKTHGDLRAGERASVNGRFYLVLVPAGHRERYQCDPVNVPLWQCKGKHCKCLDGRCLPPQVINETSALSCPGP